MGRPRWGGRPRRPGRPRIASLPAALMGDFPKPASLAEADYLRIVQALRQEPLSFDELIARTQFSAAKLNSLLTMLELKGIIDQSAGRTYATKS